MKLTGPLANFKPWSTRDLAILRERYSKDGAAAVSAATGHPHKGVCSKAHRLGIAFNSRRWSPKDDRELRMLWDDISLRGLATKFSRSTYAVYQRAKLLGLKLGAPDGWEFLTAAEERVGFDIETIRLIVSWAEANGVLDPETPVIRDAMQVPKKKDKRRPARCRFRRQIVDAAMLDEAIEAWMQTERLQEGARRHGVAGDTLRRALRSHGVTKPAQADGRRVHWRIPSETIDRAMADRNRRESLNAAARRHGISQPTLLRRLRAAGVERTSWGWNLPRTEFDRVMALRPIAVAMRRPAKQAPREIRRAA